MPSTKSPKPSIQWLAIGRVVADLVNVQSRAAMSKEDEKEFADAMRADGWGSFPPIVVFFDGKKYWLADGFHRYYAARKAGLDQVRAEVKEGSKRDAVIYSAGANIKFSIKRTAEDKNRAVILLLQDSEWFNKASTLIADHVGYSMAMVSKIRTRFCVEHNLALPDKVVGPDGKARHAMKPDGPHYRTVLRQGKRFGYSQHKNSKVHFGEDGPEARRKFEEFKSRLRNAGGPWGLSSLETLQSSLLSRGYLFSGKWAVGGSFTRFGVTGLVGNGCILAAVFDDDWPGVMACIGQVIVGSRLNPGCTRKVILCRITSGISSIAELARTIDGGIEFMTPEEFVADLKSRGH